METWEMVKAITEDPSKKFRSLITEELVEIELNTSIRVVVSGYGCSLHIDDEWEEVFALNNYKLKSQCYSV